MKREILFRGKRVDNGEWAYGYYFHHQDGDIDAHFIIDKKGFDTEVIPETVGQVVGLSDKGGMMIFEDDIIFSEHWNPMLYKVIFHNGKFCFVSFRGEENTYTINIHYAQGFKVQSNVHDNPEILKA